jgi:hypothetical protein
MSSAASPRRSPFAASGDELGDYRTLSVLAVVGLVLGIGSIAALLAVPFWGLPAAGIIVNSLALWRISRRQPALGGGRLATAGLALSLFWAAAAPVDTFVYQRLIRGQARRAAERWFDALARGQPQEAHQLTLLPKKRAPRGQPLWQHYRQVAQAAGELRSYVDQPTVRTLLALSTKVRVRYYETVDQGRDDSRDWVALIYAVTYDEGEGPKTFFIELLVDRDSLEPGTADWRIARINGGVRPAGW